MNFRSIIAGLTLGIAALAMPASAHAAEGFARSSGSLRAGPGGQYPAIVYVRRGTPLEVYGCISRYSWCDVSADGERGWFPGSRISFMRDGRAYPLGAMATILGLSILTFELNDYWGNYYMNRPWYDEPRWRRHRHLPPPPPGGHFPPPPGGHFPPPPGPHFPPKPHVIQPQPHFQPPGIHKPIFPNGPSPQPKWQHGPGQPDFRPKRHCVPPEVCN